jgi:hypothetical protein
MRNGDFLLEDMKGREYLKVLDMDGGNYEIV